MAYYGLKTFTFRSYGLHSGSTQNRQTWPDYSIEFARLRETNAVAQKMGFTFEIGDIPTPTLSNCLARKPSLTARPVFSPEAASKPRPALGRRT